MQEIVPDVFRVQPSKVTPTKYLSFFVKRPRGNLIFACFARGGSIESSFAQIEQLGGVARQFLGDMHHKSSHCDEVFRRFGAYTYCSDVEGPDTSKSVKNLRTFPFVRAKLEPDIEVLPTPGHRSGACCYLITLKKRRVLFAGDNVFFDGARWIALPSKAGKADMIQSLRLMASCEYDTLFANSLATESVCSISLPSAARKRALFEEITGVL